MVRVFGNGSAILDASMLNTQHYKVQIKGKRRNPGKEVAPTPRPLCSIYCKRSLQVMVGQLIDR